MMQQKHTDKFTDGQLIERYKITPVLSKLAHYFDVPDVTIWRRAKKLGLEFKIGGGAKKIELNEILEGAHPTYQTLKLKKRLIKEKVLEYKCVSCGISEWNDKEISLHLDHIDGNNHNHKLENLRLLCPNCHSQTETWCGKNK
jgi:Zn finger protein HypA/HybF involved in hydrogenase expression